MEDKYQSWVWGCLVIAGVFAVASAVTGVMWLRFRKQTRSWTSTWGIITDSSELGDEDGFTAYFAVRFKDDNGRGHTTKRLMARNHHYREGDAVPVVYPPGQPEKAQVRFPHMLYNKYGIVLAFLLSPVLLFGFFALATYLEHRGDDSEPESLRTGTPSRQDPSSRDSEGWVLREPFSGACPGPLLETDQLGELEAPGTRFVAASDKYEGRSL